MASTSTRPGPGSCSRAWKEAYLRQIGVVDNDGLPANPPDAFIIFLTPFELGCAFPIDGLFPIEQGNIIVKHNTP